VRGAFHHSLEIDHTGNIWACGESASPAGHPYFRDQLLVNISPSGKVIKAISITKILLASKLEYLIYGMSRPEINVDPFHLNQISPIPADMGLLKQGHLLVSCRNISTVFVVDPEVESVVWHKSGPWMNQHCVMPLGESMISVFDNHCYATGEEHWLMRDWESKVLVFDMVGNSVAEKSFSHSGKNLVRVLYGGRACNINKMYWMIEDSDRGVILIFERDVLVYKWVNRYPNGRVGPVSWCRYLGDGAVPKMLNGFVAP
jgi:hypothetical protein